jgi:hypothetical protein
MLFYILLSTIVAGIIAIIADVLIKQKIIQPLYEQQYMPKECIEYRKTYIHLLSVFLVGIVVYLINFVFKVNKLFHFRNGY